MPDHFDNDQLRVLAIPGSIRSDSLNVRLLEAARSVADRRAEIEIIPAEEIRALPAFDPDAAEIPEPVERVRRAVESADAILIATPEYHGSIPGTLKNVVDWAGIPNGECPLRGKPAAVIGADRGTIGCDWALADARKVLESVGARTIPLGVSLTEADAAFTGDGGLRDSEQARQLVDVIEELIAEGSAP